MNEAIFGLALKGDDVKSEHQRAFHITDVNAMQLLKASAPMVVVDRGMLMDCSPIQFLNTPFPKVVVF